MTNITIYNTSKGYTELSEEDVEKFSKSDLDKLTKSNLIQFCRRNRIKGYSGKKKIIIIKLILNYYKKWKNKSEEQQVRIIRRSLKDKKWREIIMFHDKHLQTNKCNACGKIDFKGEFAVIGNKRLICKTCERKISLLQYKGIKY